MVDDMVERGDSVPVMRLCPLSDLPHHLAAGLGVSWGAGSASSRKDRIYRLRNLTVKALGLDLLCNFGPILIYAAEDTHGHKWSGPTEAGGSKAAGAGGPWRGAGGTKAKKLCLCTGRCSFIFWAGRRRCETNNLTRGRSPTAREDVLSV